MAWRDCMDADLRMVGALRFARILNKNPEIPDDIKNIILRASRGLSDVDLAHLETNIQEANA